MRDPNRRSKVSTVSDPVAVAPLTVRSLFQDRAAKKALKAIKRHGERSYQALKALRSRWLRQPV